MSERAIDQIPPLADFERWLLQASIGGDQLVGWSGPNKNQKRRPFILEMVAKVRQHVMDEHLPSRTSAICIGDRLGRSLRCETPDVLQRFVKLKPMTAF